MNTVPFGLLFGLSIMSSAAQAQPCSPIRLLTSFNAGFEQPALSTSGEHVITPTGWTANAPGVVVHRDFTESSIPIPTEGNQFLALNNGLGITRTIFVPFPAKLTLNADITTRYPYAPPSNDPDDAQIATAYFDVKSLTGFPVWTTAISSTLPTSPQWNSVENYGYVNASGTYWFAVRGNGATPIDRAYFDNIRLEAETAAAVANPGGAVTTTECRSQQLVATVVGLPPVAVQWQVQTGTASFVDVIDGVLPGVGMVFGATQSVMTVSQLQTGVHVFRAFASNECGSAFGGLSSVTVLPLNTDFNNDGLFPSDEDLVDFLNVFAGGSCSTNNCDNIDINRDGLFPSDDDLIACLVAIAGGQPCPI